MSRVRSRRAGGFTLIEILVALGIAGSALLLVLSANNASLRRSVGAREDLRLLRASESKYEEVLSGIEKGASGDLEGAAGCRWEVFRAKTHVAGLKKLLRVEFVVSDAKGMKLHQWVGFHETE